MLNLPIILVLTGAGMGRSAAAMVYGFEKFDPELNIKGVIFNKLKSETHYNLLKESVEYRCRAKVLGYLPGNEEISTPERHLGLINTTEEITKVGKIEKMAELAEKYINLDLLLEITKEEKGSRKEIFFPTVIRSQKPIIAIAMDDAFCFYYKENLEILEGLGAKLSYFSPLKDKKLPKETRGLFLGGGYPELFGKILEDNRSLMANILEFSEAGGPIYAECGGLIYLGKSLTDLGGKPYKMVGIFPWVSKMLAKRKSLGYREIQIKDNSPFSLKGEKVRGHEFHYSEISNVENIECCYKVSGRRGPLKDEGYFYKNTLVSYVHLHFASNRKFAERFINSC